MKPSIPFCLPNDMTVKTFLAEYWQKKPLLIKNGLPAIANLFCPDDVMALALEEEVVARLITQHPTAKGDQWQVKNAPLHQSDFEHTPALWTVLIQNLEQWSFELGELWTAFDFIPKWQQDDIMVSYAPAGGSVGKHYDEYDVFLAQGYGARRWQLGKMCDDDSQFMANQPIRLLDDMGEIIFDEILQAGDVLYVPPKLAHYGVAQNDCLTFSFGFRRPSMVQILDKLADIATTDKSLFLPLNIVQIEQDSAHLLHKDSIAHIKKIVIDKLQSEDMDEIFGHAIAELVSRRQYEALAFFDEPSLAQFMQLLDEGANVSLNHASRFIYHQDHWYINGEKVEFDADSLNLLRFFINGGVFDHTSFDNFNMTKEMLSESLLLWLSHNWLIINDMDEINDVDED